MKPRFFGLWTVRFALGLAAIFLLMLIPLPSLYIMMFGMALLGPVMWGLLPHLLTLGLFLDVSLGRLSRKWLILPVAAYASYYVFFAYEYRVVHRLEKQLQSENSSVTIDFDSARNALAMTRGERLVTYNKIPVVYEENSSSPSGFISYRLATAERCKELRTVKKDSFDVFGVHWNRGEGVLNSRFLNQCQFRAQESPTKEVVKVSSVETRNLIEHVWFALTASTVSTRAKIVGTVIDATTMRLPMLPLSHVVCSPLVTSPNKCDAGFYRSLYALGVISDDAALQKYGGGSVENLLKLERYRESDFDSFRDYPENIEFIDALITRYRNETDEDLNEWGVRKDHPSIPKLEFVGDIESYTGSIYPRREGGPFYAFIKRNAGKTVFIDATISPNVNRSSDFFSIYGVCRDERKCGRIDHSYRLVGVTETLLATNLVKGSWAVSDETIVPDTDDPRGDTVNTLTRVDK